MENQPLKISRIWQNQDESQLEINYCGFPKDNSISKEKLEEVLNNIFYNREVAPSLADTATILKNIFRELEEHSLEIYVDKEKEYYEGALYYQGKLTNYSYHKISMTEEKADIEMNYTCTPKKGVQIKFTTNDNFQNEYNIAQYQNEFNECINTIQKLLNINIKKLYDYDKFICTIYRLFYQENPDFSKQEHRTKTQTMLAFLAEYDICIPRNQHKFYSFNLRSNSSMLSSMDLICDLHDLAPLGEIPEEISSIQLPRSDEQTIEKVGQEIRKHMNKQENPIAWFVNLVRINYIKKNCLSSNSSTQDIAEYSNCSQDTVTNSLKLVRKIDKKVK